MGWIRISAVLIATCVVITLSGCSNPTTAPTTTAAPSGTLSITSPVGGEIFAIGDQVTVSWACDCSNIPAGDSVSVFVYDGASGYLIISSAGMSGTKTWTAGTTLQNVALLPGFYQVVLQENLGGAIVSGRLFQIVVSK